MQKSRSWEELEDDILICLNGRLGSIGLFEELYVLGIRQPRLLGSIAYISSKPNRSRDQSIYFEHISCVAEFLSLSRSKRLLKLKALETVMTCLSTEETSWQTNDSVLENTLDFLICPERIEWEFPQHSESILLWELRAMCLRFLALLQEKVERVAKTGDTAVILLAATSKLVEEGMARSVPVIKEHIDQAAAKVKENLTPNESPLLVDRDAVIALAFADAARRVSAEANDSTRKAVCSVFEASSKGLRALGDKLGDCTPTESLSPESVAVLRAAGRVGVATVGAAAVVAEATLESSRAVAFEAAMATADVVELKYGTSAGQVASDASHTAANVYRTFGNVALVSESTVLAKNVARYSGKGEVEEQVCHARRTIAALEKHASSLLESTSSLPTLFSSSSRRLPSTLTTQNTKSDRDTR